MFEYVDYQEQRKKTVKNVNKSAKKLFKGFKKAFKKISHTRGEPLCMYPYTTVAFNMAHCEPPNTG